MVLSGIFERLVLTIRQTNLSIISAKVTDIGLRLLSVTRQLLEKKHETGHTVM